MTVEVLMTSLMEQKLGGKSIEVVSASEAKNLFGQILDRALSNRIISITKHNKPKVVVLSIEEFEQILARIPDPLQTLTSEFDVLVRDMQTPASVTAAGALFEADTKILAEAALAEAQTDA